MHDGARDKPYNESLYPIRRDFLRHGLHHINSDTSSQVDTIGDEEPLIVAGQLS
jgi:hypothetical protein